MHHYDPWVFGLIWQAEYQEELRRLARARLARQAVPSQAAPSSRSSTRRAWSRLGRLLSTLTSCRRWRLRGPAVNAS
jgi:hypothetical protein